MAPVVAGRGEAVEEDDCWFGAYGRDVHIAVGVCCREGELLRMLRERDRSHSGSNLFRLTIQYSASPDAGK